MESRLIFKGDIILITDTIIKWNQVNMRSQNKNLPDEHTDIIYYSGKIYDGIVSRDSKGKLCVNADFKKKEIKTGFLWCYQKDIPTPEEI